MQRKIRVWSVATGEVERDFLGEFNSISPDAKTLLYGVATGLQVLNLETGTVRTLASSPQSGLVQYGVLGWNPSGSKFFLSVNNTTQIWDLGTLKLEKTLTQTAFPWNSLGAPADTGVTFLAQYDNCSLKILDLKTLNVTRTLDETALDALEIKLALNATYFNESEYGISGTASISGTSFKVRGKGYAGTNGRLVPQTSYFPMSANLELLDGNAAVVWRVPDYTTFVGFEGNQKVLNGFVTSSANVYGYSEDGYSFKLGSTP